jgi:hypothetical protein
MLYYIALLVHAYTGSVWRKILEKLKILFAASFQSFFLADTVHEEGAVQKQKFYTSLTQLSQLKGVAIPARQAT